MKLIDLIKIQKIKFCSNFKKVIFFSNKMKNFKIK